MILGENDLQICGFRDGNKISNFTQLIKLSFLQRAKRRPKCLMICFEKPKKLAVFPNVFFDEIMQLEMLLQRMINPNVDFNTYFRKIHNFDVYSE